MAIKKNALMDNLRAVNNRYMYLLEAFQIPSVKDDIECSDYLVDDGVKKPFPKLTKKDDLDETQQEDRLQVMQNKISSKYLQRKRKQPVEGKAQRRQLLKKKNLTKSLRKVQMIERNQQIKQERIKQEQEPAAKKPKEKVFNAESKIVFSKIQFDENDKQRKGMETDAKKLLRKVLEEKKELNELKSSGDTEKYAEIKNKKAWERATAKTLGHKIKDDIELLSKKIHKRKTQVKKSKQEWAQRKEKVEHQKNMKQKKRTENLKERADKKKNKKMQKLAKKGRIIPGF